MSKTDGAGFNISFPSIEFAAEYDEAFKRTMDESMAFLSRTILGTTVDVPRMTYTPPDHATVAMVRELVREWKAPAPPPDPRVARERSRAEIDAVLREDARRYPAFATARKAAILCSCEGGHGSFGMTYPSTARAMLTWLHEYEACGHYEAARGMR